MKRHKRAAALLEWLAGAATREQRMHLANTAGGMSMTQIAHELGLSVRG